MHLQLIEKFLMVVIKNFDVYYLTQLIDPLSYQQNLFSYDNEIIVYDNKTLLYYNFQNLDNECR